MNVADHTQSQDRLVKNSALPRTLMGGTRAMRAAAQEYLPQEPAESQRAYQIRLGRATLFNAFRKTVRDMTGKVFTKPVLLGDDVPAQLRRYAENVDLAGRHINVFARDVFFDAMQTGIAYILTEMPKPVARDDGREATLEDQRAAGVRPYLCHIRIEDLLGWKAESIAGVETLTQVRIRECVKEPDGQFGERMIEQIRVIEPGSYQLWRKPDDGGDWALFEEGPRSIAAIPLAPVYLNRTAFMEGEPPLEDLADLNVAHWQSQSDQRTILHVARVPILFGCGFDDQSAQVEIGASSMARATDPNAKLVFVEHSGAAIGAGRDDLKDLEFQMQVQGLELLVARPGNQGATGAAIDEAKVNAPLAMMAMGLQDGLEASFGFMAEYEGLGRDAGGSVTVNTDFGVSVTDAADLNVLISARKAGDISRRSFWDEMRRRNVFGPQFDPDAEETALAEETEGLEPEEPIDPRTGQPIETAPTA